MKNLLIVALISTGVFAASPGNMMPSYSDFDTDNNGKVTQEEFENTQQKRMTKRAEEGRMMRKAGNAPGYSDIDANGDGNIDKEEFQSHQSKNRQNRGQGQGKNR